MALLKFEILSYDSSLLSHLIMPTVDFYLVHETSLSNCYRTICRLIDKAYQQQRRVYVNSNSVEEAKVLDDLLWTFRDDSFIPHEICYANSPAPTVPVQIGHALIPTHHDDVLINLQSEIPDFFNQFQRVLEVVVNDDNAREISRKKFRFYRQHDCVLTSHDLTQSDLVQNIPNAQNTQSDLAQNIPNAQNDLTQNNSSTKI